MSPVTSYKHVILGGGMVAGYCAKEYIEMGGKPSDLAIISADDAVPYERPPLSKSFLAGKDDEQSVLINKPEFYRDHGIELRLNTVVTALDTGARQLRTDSGEEIGFDKLVLATGAEVRKLEIPGASSVNVLYLRSLRDSTAIRDLAMTARRAVVAGGGFIAMEVASVLAQRKLDTTMLVRDERIWQAFFTPEMSAFFEKYYADRGVTLIKRTTIAAIDNGGKLRLTNGRTVESELIVAGIGVRPVTELATQAGLAVDNGITVNESLESTAPHIYAAGDVANYPDSLFGNKRRRVEHWDNAVSQGQHVARALLGHREPFIHVPYFFSDVFDLSYEFWGDPSDSSRIVHRGDLHTNSFSVWWLRENTLVAAFAMNRPDEERERAPELIRSKQKLSPERLREAASVRDAIQSGP
ncbi:MAG TPA: FAD-dependent oxidoreductase [Bryobacteraceae bacterium]|nr:FAD-dependent oxidoreductase [Bryobacteraceae bacterium]